MRSRRRTVLTEDPMSRDASPSMTVDEKAQTSREGSTMGTNSSSDGDEWVKQLGGLCGPGAGLRHVDMPLAEIDSIFDSIFAPRADEPTILHDQTPEVPNPVRLYGSNEDILDAYYIFIHPYFPILPPPERSPVYSRPLPRRVPGFHPSNGLGLAISAILVLIPHYNEKDPTRADYVKLRRDFGHCFAKSAMEAIESEYEPLRTCTNPSNPSAEGVKVFDREPFHSTVPVCLEGVIALAILSIYEYAQRGNMNEMLHRANQSLALAMSLSLHETMDEDAFAEARRRTWWMTYMTVCQGLAVSNTAPTFDLYDPWFVTPFPEGWKLLVESQQAILESATFAREVDETMKADGDPSWIPQRMTSLDSQIASLLLECREAPPVSQMAPSSGSPEYVASTTMRAFAEIKLHTPDMHIPFAFSSDTSSKICLHAALNTITLLDNLPYPKPANETAANPPSLPRSQTTPPRPPPCLEIPRTMPTLVCCAMQAGFCLLMLCVKARGFQQIDGSGSRSRSPGGLNTTTSSSNGGGGTSLVDFRSDLHRSLKLVVKLIGNYSLAFEALQGIRDEIAQAIEKEFRR
ncbi:hypothetical protein FE257_002410 [Aspergillus nanangensis]|uniref:Transcription factor domain-containing protein n=1 Tax=Aspergillus nanangensis TaxID=2582783 RepID=A0AAD4CCK1_ASPNN|nr:hypothetical protein FE257_002410 [Aspergillus nanangensis]